MTTTFELASTLDSYQFAGITRASDPASVYNSLARVPSARASAPTAAASSRPDTSSISGTSALVAASLAQNDVRTGRIATLRQAIAGGTYHVSAADLATTILAASLS